MRGGGDSVDGEIVDGDGLWAPLGWLQTMAHARDEPPRSAMAFLGGAHRSSSRLRPLSVDQKLSRFYQQRERDDDDHDETFFSIPVGVSEAYEYREPLHRRYVVQPLDCHCLSARRRPSPIVNGPIVLMLAFQPLLLILDLVVDLGLKVEEGKLHSFSYLPDAVELLVCLVAVEELRLSIELLGDLLLRSRSL